jgi:hypothetical protein
MARKKQPSPKPEGLKALLEQLDAWLKKHRRRYHRGLRPGATDDELAALSTALGGALPEPLAVWLRWHNGQDEDLIGAFVESFRLMSTADIVGVLGKQRNPVPILEDDTDDRVVLDTTVAGLPVREVWHGRDQPIEAAPSLEVWVAGLLRDFEAGRYHEDPERGDFVREPDGA